MKKLIYLVFMIMLFTFTTCYVHASCTNEEISSLKKEAEKIKVTYKHLGAVEDDEGITVYDKFNVTFKNVNDDLYIELFNFSYTNYPENGVIIDTFTTGNWNFDIYSDKCEMKIKEIKVVLPKFNIYSSDPLCEGIDGNDFALCGKYYDYDISYTTFKEKVESYRKLHNIADNNGEKEVEKREFLYYWNYIYDFVYKNIIYFAFGFGLLILLLLVFMIIKRRKNRGVLK